MICQRLQATELQLERDPMGRDPGEAQLERGHRRPEVRWLRADEHADEATECQLSS